MSGDITVTEIIEIIERGVERAGRRAWREAAREIAHEIRAELVCCDIYERIHGTEAVDTTPHQICFWGEAGARIAERIGRGERHEA